VGLSIEEQIARLPSLDKSELHLLWQQLFGRAASMRLRRQVMIPVLAYRIQEQAHGGLKPSTVKRLRDMANALEINRSAVLNRVPRVAPGTRLIREWRGKTHEVLSVTNGYEYQGSVFASLSEIARQITGTRWSGPLFFGIKKSKPRGVK
jgi:DUF2924 family protein